MSRPIDLLLITDEPIDWEGDYWARSNEKVEREQRNVGITTEDKERCERKYGVRDYFRPLRNADGSNGRYRIRVPHRPHLSLTDLATVAKEHGYEPCVVDNALRYPSRWSQIEAVLQEKPRAVGVSTTFLLTPQVVRHYVEKLREISPETKIILGGPTVRKCEELHGYADFAVFGEGEDPLLAIMGALDGDVDPATIPYIAYKDDNGELKYGPQGAEVSHVGVKGKAFKARDSHIPVADWTLANRSYDNVFSIEFSRGCKYNCFYCSYDRGKTIRDLGEIREELLRNAELGITKYRVADSNFTDGPPRYKRYPHDVCQLMVDLNLGLVWSCYARVDDLSDELATLMREAGCCGVFFGLESGSDRILKNMRKGHNSDDAREGIAIAKRNGLRCHGSFIVGYPGETMETHEETLAFIEETRPDTVNIGQFRVEQDTPVYGVKDFELEGQGMVWQHKTMDNKMTYDLVTKANQRLLKNGVCLGTEYSFPTFMGLGLSLPEAHQMMWDMDLIGREERKDEPVYAEARERLRKVILETFPSAIAKDQQMWDRITV